MSEVENENVEDTGGCGGCGGCDGGCTSCTETQVCPNHPQWCSPETVDLGDHSIGESEPCEEPELEPKEICSCHTEKECPVHLKLGLTYQTKGCDKHPCIDSIPPNLGCIPIHAGVGQWDGGVPSWLHACTTGCELEVLEAKNPYFLKRIMPQGESLMDLNTHPEHTTNLWVMRDTMPQRINMREFLALSVKMYKTGMKVSKGVDPSSLELGYVTAADGSVMLSIISEGAAVGNGLALVVDPVTGAVTLPPVGGP